MPAMTKGATGVVKPPSGADCVANAALPSIRKKRVTCPQSDQKIRVFAQEAGGLLCHLWPIARGGLRVM